MPLPHEKKGTSIQSRLILLLLVIFIPVLVIQAYMYCDSYQYQRASALQTNLEIARSLAKAFESFVKDVLHQELAIGLAITSSQPMTSKDITRLLETTRDYIAVRDFTWLNPRGVAVYSSNPAMIGINYSDRPFFREIAIGREWVVSELMIAKTTGEPIFGISQGIWDGKGTLLGIVSAAVIPEKLGDRLAVERGKGGGHALVDNKGMMVYRYPVINATWEERNWLKPYPEFEEALKGREIATTVYAPFEGQNRLVGFTPVSSIGWAASAGTREEDVTGPILSSIAKSALLFLFVSLAAFFVALAVSRKITSPVAALRSHALALGQGEVPEQVKINHISEFEDLADAFNTMAMKVQAREMDLRESEERGRQRTAELEAIFAAHNDATLVYDTEMNVRLVTPSFFTIYGFDPVGLNVREIIQRVSCRWLDGRPFKLEEQPTPRALEGEKVTGAVFIVKRADGTDAIVETSSGPIRMGGHITGSVTVWHDITERKKAEQALKERTAKLEEINKELESFSYSISHDLRAPLRAIDGFVRMLLKKHGHEFDEDSMRKFNVIRSNSQMMGQLIDDILTLSRLGRAKMSIANLEMEGIIKDVWTELQTINPERNMTLSIRAMPSACGDKTLIKQVYANLLSNAVKFTKYKDPAEIEAGGYTDGDDHVYYVKDNGTGFDMAYYDKLFGIFQRLHNNPDFEGTGVGLAIIHRVILMHGGRVWAEGKVDEGATFYFSLPS